MPLPRKVLEVLSEELHALQHVPVRIRESIPMSGGSINDAYRLETDLGPYFLKTNSADRYPSMFAAEADGLERLRATATLAVPEVLGHGKVDDTTYLLLAYQEAGVKRSDHWEQLGRGLAALHRHSQERFGLERDNYIGSLVQTNSPRDDWHTFFAECRLEPMVRKARDLKRLGGGDAIRFERLHGRLDALFPREAPALLHGDLWSGNLITTAEGGPCVIDPAVYYGHREMDLAMMRLFGGFDPATMTAYQEAWPLEPGWPERQDLCNLYPLLVHVVLFGGGYVQQVDRILRRFT